MEVVINPNFYINKLRQRLNSELLALRSALRHIESGANHELGRHSENSPTNIVIIGNVQVEEDIQREIRKTFCAVIRDFNDYLDELIAIKKLLAMPQKPDKVIRTESDVDEYVRKLISEKAQKIGKDGHLSKHEKVALTGSHEDFLKNATEGYFDLRAALEHHKGVAQKDINLSYYRQEYLVGGKPTMLNKPTLIRDTTIGLRVSEETQVIKTGSRIKLTESDVEAIVLTISLHFASAVAKQYFK